MSQVKVVHNYRQAEQLWANTECVRGRGGNAPKPLLPSRRNPDAYWVRKNGGDGGSKDAIQFMLYRTAVVTFFPPTGGDAGAKPEVVVIFDGGYQTQSTANFISAVLGVHTTMQNGLIAVHGTAGTNIDKPTPAGWYRLNSEGQLLMYRAQDFTGGWAPANPTAEHVHSINRKGTSAIRKRYKPFTDYVASMLKLRTDPGRGTYTFTGQEYREAALAVLEEAYGSDYTTTWEPRHVSSSVDALSQTIRYKRAENYHDQMGAFIRMAATPPGDTQMQRFYAAMTVLLSEAVNYRYHHKMGGVDDNRTYMGYGNKVRPVLLEILYKWHSDEALVREELALGQIGTDKFANWA